MKPFTFEGTPSRNLASLGIKSRDKVAMCLNQEYINGERVSNCTYTSGEHLWESNMTSTWWKTSTAPHSLQYTKRVCPEESGPRYRLPRSAIVLELYWLECVLKLAKSKTRLNESTFVPTLSCWHKSVKSNESVCVNGWYRYIGHSCLVVWFYYFGKRRKNRLMH